MELPTDNVLCFEFICWELVTVSIYFKLFRAQVKAAEGTIARQYHLFAGT